MKKNMIGITGPTGSGKGTVTQMLSQKLNYSVIDADQVVRKRYMTPGTLCASVRAAFGDDVMHSDGTVDRNKLSRVVFTSESALEKLNEAVLPIIADEILQIAEKCNKNIILDGPTLFEAGLDKHCSIVIGVIAEKACRLDRIVARDHISLDRGKDRIDSQKSDEFYMQHCDKVIVNNGDLAHLEQQVQQLIDERSLIRDEY